MHDRGVMFRDNVIEVKDLQKKIREADDDDDDDDDNDDKEER